MVILRDRIKMKVFGGTLVIVGLVLYTNLALKIFCESEPPISSVLPSLNHNPPHRKSVLPPINAKLSLKDENGVSELSTSTIEIKGEMLPTIKPFACLSCKINFGKKLEHYLMCIKGLDVDSVISGYIYYEGYWERDMLQLMLKILQAYPNATLLDVGSNIGMFSVTAAAANYSVVAVDPFKTNLAYIRLSTVLHGSQDNVRYIPHTISDEKSILYPWNIDKSNEGATPFVTADVARTKPSEEIGEGVESITFNELLDVVHTDTVIVKMDIQGAECKALIPFLQKKIKTKYIPYIIMEWQWITYNMMGLCPDIQPLIKAFLDNGYFPANVTTRHELDIETQKTWYDVLWVHQDAIH